MLRGVLLCAIGPLMTRKEKISNIWEILYNMLASGSAITMSETPGTSQKHGMFVTPRVSFLNMYFDKIFYWLFARFYCA